MGEGTGVNKDIDRSGLVSLGDPSGGSGGGLQSCDKTGVRKTDWEDLRTERK